MKWRMKSWMVWTSVGVGAGIGIVGGALGLAAQNVPVSRTGEPEMTYQRDFSDLRSLRELSNGGLIAVEGVGGEVVLLAADGVGEQLVGRHGQGPGEYMAPSVVIPLGPSDFSLLVDPAQQRLLVLDPGGRVLVSEPWRLPLGVLPLARDATEGMYSDEIGIIRSDRAGNVIEGPVPLLRFHREQEAPDTLARLAVHNLAARYAASPVSRMFRPGPTGFARFRVDRSPFGAQDQWKLLSDGRIAIARVDPYRIDIVNTDGSVVRGPEVPYEPVPVTRADRSAFLASMGRGEVGGGGGMSFSTSDGRNIPIRPPEVSVEELPFPKNKPPFPFGGLHARPQRGGSLDPALYSRERGPDLDRRVRLRGPSGAAGGAFR